MTPQETKHIINVVVDYGWPWQAFDLHTVEDVRTMRKSWKTQIDQSIQALCQAVAADQRIGLDPTHEWNWPIETREGMPCWHRYRIGALTGQPKGWLPWISTRTDMKTIGLPIDVSHTVAPHPLQPNEPPPADWTPEGRRVLK